MNVKHWRKAGAAAALSLALAAPANAFPLFGDHEPASVRPAIEYHNAEYGEYLITVSPREIAALDAGSAPGWVRARRAFSTVDAPASAPVVSGYHATAFPVCRYFIPPAAHFLSASPGECAQIVAVIPDAVLETEAAFYAWLPNASGQCPKLFAKIGGFRFDPVYRLYDGAQGTAHRLTTSKAERDAMVADGWVSAGYGADGVAMCVPSSGS